MGLHTFILQQQQQQNIQKSQFSRSVMPDSATPWTAARQASLSITNSQSLLKLMSTESVMQSNDLILCRSTQKKALIRVLTHDL